jgi:hypothetical protein
MSERLRLELASLTEHERRIAALETQLERLTAEFEAAGIVRALRNQKRRGAVTESRYASILDLAALLNPGPPATVIRQIEKVWQGPLTPPPGAAKIMHKLRAEYGHGGPSPATIRRALKGEFSKLSD